MSNFPEGLQLEMLFDVHIDLEPPQDLGSTPLGARRIFIVKSGTFEGPKMRGTMLRGGGDWWLGLPNHAGELDVRATLRTDDGAMILMTYCGVLDVTPEVAARALSSQGADPSEYYFRTTPRFETGAEQYAWLNKLICVATGWMGSNKVAYRVFAVR
jgi:hypothetical protein